MSDDNYVYAEPTAQAYKSTKRVIEYRIGSKRYYSLADIEHDYPGTELVQIGGGTTSQKVMASDGKEYAVNYTTYQAMTSAAAQQYIDSQPTEVTISIGGNDKFTTTKVNQTATSIQDLYAKILQATPDKYDAMVKDRLTKDRAISWGEQLGITYSPPAEWLTHTDSIVTTEDVQAKKEAEQQAVNDALAEQYGLPKGTEVIYNTQLYQQLVNDPNSATLVSTEQGTGVLNVSPDMAANVIVGQTYAPLISEAQDKEAAQQQATQPIWGQTNETAITNEQGNVVGVQSESMQQSILAPVEIQAVVNQQGTVVGFEDAIAQQSYVDPFKTKATNTVLTYATLVQPAQTLPKEQQAIVHELPAPQKGTFEYAVQQQQKREAENAAKLQKVQETARVLTFGGSKSYEMRNWFGKFSENIVSGLMSFPLALGSGVASAGEKAYILAKYRKEYTTDDFKAELLRSVKSQEFKDTFNPIKPEGAATYAFALAGGLAKAYPKLRVTETPIKAKAIDVYESVRETAKGLKSDKQIQVQTIEGKPQTRNVFQKSSIKVESVVDAKFERLTSQGFSELKSIESAGELKAQVKFAENKAAIKNVDYKEISAPKEVLDPAMRYSGKTKTGAPLEGKTPQLKTKQILAESSELQFKGQTIKRTGMVLDNKGNVLKTATQKITKFTPEELKKVQLTKPRTYKTALTEGKLQSEVRMSGKFVEPKFDVKGSKGGGKPKTSGKPSVILEMDKAGKIKVYSVLESGKLIDYVGKRPVRTSGRQMSVLEELKRTTKASSKYKPVIGVDVKVAGGGKLLPIMKGSSAKKQVTLKVAKTTRKASTGKGAFTPTPLRNVVLSDRDLAAIFGPQKLKTPAKSILSSIQAPDYRQDITPIIDVTQSQKNAQDIIAGLIPAEATAQDIAQLPAQDLKQPQDIIQDFKPPVPKPSEAKPPQDKSYDIKFPFITLPGSGEAGKKETGYNVYMKEGGKQVKANMKPLPKKEAHRLGKDIAENSLSASYRVSKTNKRVPSARRSPLAQGMQVSDANFKRSKNWQVEKNRFRLNTPGEKQGIQASKLIASRKKGLLKKIKWR